MGKLTVGNEDMYRFLLVKHLDKIGYILDEGAKPETAIKLYAELKYLESIAKPFIDYEAYKNDFSEKIDLPARVPQNPRELAEYFGKLMEWFQLLNEYLIKGLNIKPEIPITFRVLGREQVTAILKSLTEESEMEVEPVEKLGFEHSAAEEGSEESGEDREEGPVDI